MSDTTTYDRLAEKMKNEFGNGNECINCLPGGYIEGVFYSAMTPGEAGVTFVINALEEADIDPKAFCEAAHRRGFTEFTLEPDLHEFGQCMSVDAFLQISAELIK